MATAPRLYVDDDLAEHTHLEFQPGPTNYLLRVMRLGPGDPVRLFNGRDGEWRARLEVQGRRAYGVVETCSRLQTSPPELTLVFAPLKKTRTDFLVEKATEMGATCLRPVVTTYTQTHRVKLERLQALVTEAAEQTERLDLPRLERIQPLSGLLADWPGDRPLFYCDEAGAAPPMQVELAASGAGPAGLLIGPEGGFSDLERAQLRACAGVRPVSLGPRILRAETAAVAALALWQSELGDWRNAPYVPEDPEAGRG